MDNQKRFLCLGLGNEEYAVTLLAVQEVMTIPAITPLPMTPPTFKGLANVRGKVVPVYDMRAKLGLKPQNSAETAMVLVDYDDILIGILVDSVNRVLTIDQSKSAKNFETTISKNPMVGGVYQDSDHLVLLLRLDGLLNDAERSIAVNQSNQVKSAA